MYKLWLFNWAANGTQRSIRPVIAWQKTRVRNLLLQDSQHNFPTLLGRAHSSLFTWKCVCQSMYVCVRVLPRLCSLQRIVGASVHALCVITTIARIRRFNFAANLSSALAKMTFRLPFWFPMIRLSKRPTFFVQR